MARNPHAEANALWQAREQRAQAERPSACSNGHASRRRLTPRLLVLAPALLMASALAAGSASAVIAGKHHRRRLALRLADQRAAPVLWLGGATLHWSATAVSHRYIEARTTGAATTYVLVAGTADTPPRVPGATATYRVRPRYRPRAWSNEVKVAYPRGQHGREGEETRREREARELAEREARERAAREAEEKAAREASEKAEREAKETAERERLEREHAGGEEGGGAVVGKAPVGPPAPASGWHIIYGEAFGAPLGSGAGQDDTLQSGEKSGGCCNNSNEIAVEQHSQARVGPGGLELVCSEGSFTVEGVTRKYSCGGVRGDAFVEWNYAASGEWVAECVCRWPANTGAADPGWWLYTGAQEIDFFEGWGWNGTSWLTANAGMPVVVGQHEFELGLVASVLGFDPSVAYHRYATAFIPVSGSTFHVVEYIDGTERWSFNANLANTSDGPILTNALRRPAGGGQASPNVMAVRSVAVYQDGAHAGQGVKGGGIAPGTTVK